MIILKAYITCYTHQIGFIAVFKTKHVHNITNYDL